MAQCATVTRMSIAPFLPMAALLRAARLLRPSVTRLALLTAAALAWLTLPAPVRAAGAVNPLVAAAEQLKNSASASASAPAASQPLAQSLDQVIGTLQNDSQRQALLDQLKTLRHGLDASGAAADAAHAAASDVQPGLIGAVAKALGEVDHNLSQPRGPWQYWRWRLGFAGDEWHAALTLHDTRPVIASVREFVTVLLAWALTGWLLWELERRYYQRRLQRARKSELPAVPSWIDVGVYFMRRIGPWVVAFGLTLILSYQVFARTPASLAGVLVAFAIVAGALLASVCQVIFAVFSSAHRAHAVRDLLRHSRKLLFCTGALAALGEVSTDGRVVEAIGVNLSALVGTFANILAALLICVFAVRFRRQIGQLIAFRPLATRQSYPAWMDMLRLAGEAWHLPVLAVAFASVVGTLMASGRADEILRRVVVTVTLFVAAMLLTLIVGRSPKATVRPPRLRDRRRSAYIARFGRFAVALVRVVIWFVFLEINARVWNTSLMQVAESTILGRHVLRAAVSVTSIILLAWLCWLLIDTALTQTLSPTHGRAGQQPSLRARTILPLVRNASFVALLVIALIAVLANLGVNVTPLLAGAGVVGLAIGFGAQSLVQDLITGLFIVIEDSIAIGDSIELPDHAGVVEGMTIRTVRLRDGKGALHTLPYSQIKAVKNLSRGFAYAVFNISVAYDSDFDRALEIIRSTGAEVARDHRFGRNLLSSLDILGLDRFDPNGLVVLAQFKTRPLTQADITRAFNVRLKRNFDAAGIRLAAPRVTVQVDGGVARMQSDIGTTEAIAAGGGAGAQLVTQSPADSA